MKKIILAFTFIAGLSAAAFAQPVAKPPGQRAAHVTKVLQKQLNLTADQATQVNSIMLVRANRMDSLRNNLSATNARANKRSKRQIALGTDRDMSFVLNPDQLRAYENWKAVKKERKQANKNGSESMSANIKHQDES